MSAADNIMPETVNVPVIALLTAVAVSVRSSTLGSSVIETCVQAGPYRNQRAIASATSKIGHFRTRSRNFIDRFFVGAFGTTEFIALAAIAKCLEEKFLAFGFH
jgi:hypothetical protein